MEATGGEDDEKGGRVTSRLDGLGGKGGSVQLGFQKVRAGAKVEWGSADHGGGPVRRGARALQEGRAGTKSLEPWTGHLCGYRNHQGLEQEADWRKDSKAGSSALRGRSRGGRVGVAEKLPGTVAKALAVAVGPIGSSSVMIMTPGICSCPPQISAAAAAAASQALSRAFCARQTSRGGIWGVPVLRQGLGELVT